MTFPRKHSVRAPRIVDAFAFPVRGLPLWFLAVEHESPAESPEGLGQVVLIALGRRWEVFYAPTAERAKAYRLEVAAEQA